MSNTCNVDYPSIKFVCVSFRIGIASLVWSLRGASSGLMLVEMAKTPSLTLGATRCGFLELLRWLALAESWKLDMGDLPPPQIGFIHRFTWECRLVAVVEKLVGVTWS